MIRAFVIRKWGMPFILAAVCFLSYLGSLSHEFLLDDFIVLLGPTGMVNRTFLSVSTDAQNTFYRPAGHVLL